MVPIIWFFLFLIVIFSVFLWDSKPKQIDIENKIWLEIILNWVNSEGYIVYPWDYKKKIEWDISLYKWEKIMVKEGNVSLSLAWLNLRLHKLWDLKYLENWNFYLDSSDLWIDSITPVNLDMKFANVKIGENSHVSFSQNEMGSTVYLVSWFAEVSNLVWKTTVLSSWQKITISRSEASKKELDLTLSKENIDDYYKQSDWFIINNWPSFVSLDKSLDEDENETLTWEILKTDEILSSNLINFSNLLDESNVSSDLINVSWNFTNEEIIKITLNWKEAVLNKNLKTFKFDNVPVPNKENNLVFKVYDAQNMILSKFVYTIYYAQWSNQTTTVASNNTSTNNNSWFNVQTFDVDGSQFTFTEPTTKSTFTTSTDFVTIKWKVLIEWISKVTVNDYTLSSFNGSTWRYHASSSNNNMSIWTNLYEIKYFDPAWKMVYKNTFTIIKKD